MKNLRFQTHFKLKISNCKLLLNTMDTDSIRKNFPIFSKKDISVYLDNAASSLTPNSVIDAVQDYYQNYRANTHRGLYKEAEKATEKFEEARSTVAKFIGAESGEIVFCSGATLASNILFSSLEETVMYKKGDEILTTIVEHHAMLLPLQRLAKHKNMKIQHVPYTKEYTVDEVALLQHITKKTKIVAITLASNVLGCVTVIPTIVEKADAVGALVIVDGTAIVGHAPIDVSKLGVDYMFFSGHKMCGPTGTGVLYGKKDILKDLEPAILGGGMIDDVTLTDATWADSPQRFEAGTQNIAGVIGLMNAVDYLNSIGVKTIQSHCRELVAYALEKLGAIHGVKTFSAPPEKNVGIVSFVLEGIHPHDIAEILGKRGIAVRAGHHCALPLHKELGVSATVRASFYIYNSKADIDALIRGIEDVQKVFTIK